MTPAARIAAVIEILTEIEASTAGSIGGTGANRPAGQGLRASMQRRRYAGSGDRAAISDLFWKIHRGLARLSWHLNAVDAPVTPRNLVLGALVLMEQRTAELPQIFMADITHAPDPLSETEQGFVQALSDRQLVNPAMPAHVTLEWPEWLLDDTNAALGEGMARELAALTAEAPTDVRINALRQPDRRRLRDQLAGRGIKGHPTRLSPLGVRLEKRARLDDLAEWKAGLFEVQDEGSQIASLLCDARPGMQVADICAGAAGKSLVMAAVMANKGRILALDPSPERLENGGARLRRAAIHNVERKLIAEKWSNRSWRGKFDRVVVDAPCSGSGTWRRQVDARWQLTPARLAELQTTQAILLEKARAMVVPGGRVIYITCSVLASEGRVQIEQLLANAPELELAEISEIWADTIGKAGGGACPPAPNNMLQLLPGRDNTDGFFIAVLQAKLR